MSYKAAVKLLDINGKKSPKKVRANNTAMCPTHGGNINIRPNVILYFLKDLNGFRIAVTRTTEYLHQ